MFYTAAISKRENTMQRNILRRLFAGASLVALGVLSSGAITPLASAQSGTVRYVLTADGPWQAHIVYHVGWRESRDERVWLAPDSPWETTVTLDNPYNSASVTVAGIYADSHPNFHCQIWVDGKLAGRGGAACELLEGPPFR